MKEVFTMKEMTLDRQIWLAAYEKAEGISHEAAYLLSESEGRWATLVSAIIHDFLDESNEKVEDLNLGVYKVDYQFYLSKMSLNEFLKMSPFLFHAEHGVLKMSIKEKSDDFTQLVYDTFEKFLRDL